VRGAPQDRCSSLKQPGKPSLIVAYSCQPINRAGCALGLLSLDADEVDRLLRPWMERFLGHPLGGISADGKVLRGSKRATTSALHVVELVSQAHGEVLAQREAVGGDEVAALLVLLTEVPLAGRMISMDAGLLTAGVTQTIQQEQGDYLGSVKGNQAEV
jgi:hypothetical protein